MSEFNSLKHENNTRNVGIDLLKVLSMFMIVILHILGHGGVLETSKPLSLSHYSAWLLEVFVYCSVNCYALVSGYVNFGRRHKYSNILYLILHVLFYTIITTTAFLIFNKDQVGTTDILKALFPYAYGTYWYFSAYFCLFFFIPFLDRVILSFSKSNMYKLLVMSVIMFSLLPTLFHYDFPKVYTGYSFLWLLVLYLLGGTIKKYEIIGFKKNKINLLCFFICAFLTWLSKVCIDFGTSLIFGKTKGGMYLIAFNSPLILLCAVFLLLFCSRLSLGKNISRVIGFVVPVTFGVYLIHEEPLIRKTFIKQKFVFLLEMNPFLMVLAVLGIALIIFIIGVLIDHVRLFLFDKIKARSFCDVIEHKIDGILHRVWKRIGNKEDKD